MSTQHSKRPDLRTSKPTTWLAELGFLGLLGGLAAVLSPCDPASLTSGSSQRPPSRAVSRSAATAGLAQHIEALRARFPGESGREQLVSFLVESAAFDPAGAVRMGLELDDEDARLQVLHECLPLWLAADPEAARNFLFEAASEAPAALALALAKDAASFDPRLGFDVARQIPHVGERAPAMREVFTSWAAQDPETAALMAEGLGKAEGRPAALAEVGRLWAEKDARQAHAWARVLPDESSRRAALDPLIGTWAGRAPAEAAEALTTLPREPLRLRLTDQVATQWAARDPEAALHWAHGIPDREERSAAASTLLVELVERDPKLASAWALPLAGSATSPVLERFITAWVAKDPSGAVSWASAQSQPVLLTKALERWQTQAPEAALGWRSQHPEVLTRE